MDQRRRIARVAAPLLGVLGVGILALALTPRVDWSRPQDRTAAEIVSAVVLVGLILGALVGRFGFRTRMRRWETFSIQLTPDSLIRQMDGQETRIRRSEVTSIREYPQRGFVITDNLGWKIFVPKVVGDYDDFRQQILTWQTRN